MDDTYFNVYENGVIARHLDDESAAGALWTPLCVLDFCLLLVLGSTSAIARASR
jgi:hypothetical protein